MFVCGLFNKMAANDLTGKTVVITGATTGIGEASAVEFAKHGAKLVLCGRNLEGLTDTKQQCVKQGLGDTDVAIVTGDICKDETMDAILQTSVDCFGRIDVLFLNAGKAHPMLAPVTNPDSIEALDYCYQIQIKSPYKLTQKLSAELIKTKGNIIINSSISSSPFLDVASTPYGIMKAGQDQMTRLFALTFANKGVRVNALRPGAVRTNILSEAAGKVTPEFRDRMSDIWELLASHTPLGSTITTLEEVAQVVVFLGSSQSACMTGTLITTDKGFSMVHPAVDWKQF